MRLTEISTNIICLCLSIPYCRSRTLETRTYQWCERMAIKSESGQKRYRHGNELYREHNSYQEPGHCSHHLQNERFRRREGII